MIVKFNYDTGLMYIHFQTGVPSIQMPTSNNAIYKFVAKSNKDQLIGYEIEDAENNIKQALLAFALNRKQKLAIVMCFIREKQKKTQKEFSTIINISESKYKSIERADHNINFDTLDVIYNQFKNEEILHNIF